MLSRSYMGLLIFDLYLTLLYISFIGIFFFGVVTEPEQLGYCCCLVTIEIDIVYNQTASQSNYCENPKFRWK